MTICILECSRKTQQQIHTYIQYPYIYIWRSSAHRPISKAHKSESFPPRRQSAVQRLIGRGKLCESTCCWFSLKLFCCHIKCCYYKFLVVVGVIANSNTYTRHRGHGHQQRRRKSNSWHIRNLINAAQSKGSIKGLSKHVNTHTHLYKCMEYTNNYSGGTKYVATKRLACNGCVPPPNVREHAQ